MFGIYGHYYYSLSAVSKHNKSSIIYRIIKSINSKPLQAKIVLIFYGLELAIVLIINNIHQEDHILSDNRTK